MKLIWIPIILLFFSLLYFRFNRIGRARRRILKNYAQLEFKRIIIYAAIFFFLLFSGIEIYRYITIKKDIPNSAEAYRQFSYELIQKEEFSKLIEIEEKLPIITPELVAIIPTALKSLKEIANKDIRPTLRVQNEKQIYLQIKGFKSFKNRGIRTRKLLQKRLGKYYNVQFSESIHGAFLSIAYNGKPWHLDEILALPAAIAAKKQEIPPENVLAFYTALYPLDSLNLLNRFPPDSAAKLLKEASSQKNDSTTFAYAIRTAFPLLANDSAQISVYASGALQFAEYFRKYGLEK